MTAADSSLPVTSEAENTEVASESWFARFELHLHHASEWLNPILVKEARQALKSRQFAVTFTLLLVFGWGWSLMGVATLMSGNSYAPIGAKMLIGYYWILSFPMLVIVPFSAFRSLSSEREDGTYELLSITTLSSRQIISGKLGSAVLQMVVYYSALSPCIAFTYLLRGIDIISIVLLLAYTFVTSLLLSIIGLFLATLTKVKHWQVLNSVVAILGLAGVFWAAAAFVYEMLEHEETLYVEDAEAWLVQTMIVSAAIAYGVLIFLAAGSAISITSENRSTNLRITMLSQQVLIVGWAVFWAMWYEAIPPLAIGFVVGVIHWIALGALMTGESPVITQRVARGLPQTVLGRMYLSWLMPGPGKGYIFAVTNSLALLLTFTTATVVCQRYRFEMDGPIWPLTLGGYVLWCYLVTYLGIGRLLVAIAQRFNRAGPFLGLVINVILILAGTLGAIALQFSVLDYQYQEDYTLIQITNPFWTSFEVATHGLWGSTGRYTTAITVLVTLSSIAMLLINLVVDSSGIRREREAAPSRVVEDELELHPELATDSTPKSPWDE